MMKMKKTKAETPRDRVARIYHERCSGIQIMLTDIPNVMAFGVNYIEQVAPELCPNYPVSDQELGDMLLGFVNTIRKN